VWGEVEILCLVILWSYWCRRERLERQGPNFQGKDGAAYGLSPRLSVSPRRYASRRNGKARPEGPSRHVTVFMLRPAGQNFGCSYLVWQW